MTLTADPDLAALADVSARLLSAFESIEPDQWSVATPCDDWNLADLVDHVTGGNWFTDRVLAGDSADRALSSTMARFEGGSAGGRQASESTVDQLEAFQRPGVLDRSWQHVAGTLPGRQILRLRLHDLIVHGWDIDETLSPPASVPVQLARWGLQELTDDDSSTAEHFGVEALPGPTSPDEAGAVYLRIFGR